MVGRDKVFARGSRIFLNRNETDDNEDKRSRDEREYRRDERGYRSNTQYRVIPKIDTEMIPRTEHTEGRLEMMGATPPRLVGNATGKRIHSRVTEIVLATEQEMKEKGHCAW